MKISKMKIISTALLSTILLGSTSFAATYEVPVKLEKFGGSPGELSMGNGALAEKAKVVEDNGKADIYITLKGLKFMNMYGHLLRMWEAPEGVSATVENLNQLSLVHIEETQEDIGLDGKNHEFPSVFKLSRGTLREEKIGVRVEVDAMEEIAKNSGQANGHQAAILALNWNEAKEIEEPTPAPTPEPPAPTIPKRGYANGYEDGSFRADNPMLRSEAATIIASALGEDYDKNANYDNVFSDVKDNDWFKNPVGYMSSKGYIQGKGDGQFYPGQTVTRAEFVTMIANIKGKNYQSNAQMVDINGHWAEDKIKTAISEGWIKGYDRGDGSFEFRPDVNISRAEVVTILNRVKGLAVDKDEIKANLSQYRVPNDINESHWGFYDVLVATN